MNHPLGAPGNGQQQSQPYSQPHYASSPQQQQQQLQQPSPRQQRSGPRANCDQVVFEAIAKAAEIVVASRCNIESDPASASQTGSGRFNLLVPEVKSVRNILQRWKRTMHIPLRLDVYYQHPPKPNNEAGERELLERWCLEYAPSQSQMYDEQYSLGHVDPIVQLRKVCKNIVVWLRTLYCHSRLLPAQALRKNQSTTKNNCIGFSIYVVGEGQDDVSGLLQQGFDSEPKQSGEASTGVPTPYGVLGWRVYLAPKDLVRRLLAIEQEKARVFQQNYSNTTSVPRSIPMPQPSGYGAQTGAQPIARSAPTHNRGYRRANSDSVAAHSPSQQLYQKHQSTEQTRYYSRSPSGRNAAAPSTLLAPRSYHPGILRRNSETVDARRGLYPIDATDGNTATPNSTSSPASGEDSGKGGINPNKNLSALSLALLSMKTDTDSSPDPSENDAAAELGPSEIRRAALHNAPPTGVGEYGYAYNNNSTTTQPQTIPQTLSSSPFKGPSTPASSTFGTTPPGYLLSATPSIGSHGGILMPPARPSSGAVTPPFVRPLGFSGQAQQATEVSQQQQQSQSPQLGGTAATPENQTPSLDLLHSSPFHHSGHMGGSSNQPKDGLASFLQAGENASMEAATTFINDFYHHHYPHAMASGTEDHHGSFAEPFVLQQDEHDATEDDMPFAVDEGISLTPTSGGNSMIKSTHEASLLAASRMVPHKKLALFGSSNNSEVNDMDALTDQLADLRSFGASLASPLTTSVGSGG